MRLVALPAVFEIVPCRELGVTVGRAAICLCDVESDFPFGKRIENGLCEIGQTKPPLDVSDSAAQQARPAFLGFALIQGGAVTTAFIGGRHGFADARKSGGVGQELSVRVVLGGRRVRKRKQSYT